MKKSAKKFVYLDYAAATPLDPRVLKAMMPYFKNGELQGNPSSIHKFGRLAKSGFNKARRLVAETLKTRDDEIIFTGSGTESNNLAIMGVANAYKSKGKHIIVSQIEHKAVLESAKCLEKEGFDVSYAPVQKNGIINMERLVALARPGTILISIMHVNNETGSIQPIKKIAERIKKIRKGDKLPLMHVDACQAAAILPIRPNKLGIDLLTLNGGKIYGPKGIGCLWVKRGIEISPIIHGGGQESGLRSGTENVPFAIGFAEALQLAQCECGWERKRLAKINHMLRNRIGRIDGVLFNSPKTNASPGILNVSFLKTEGESLLLDLDRYGICCSTGSACAATDLKPSRALLAMGIPEEIAHASLRLSIGRFTTLQEIERFLKVLPPSVARIRSLCPSIFIKKNVIARKSHRQSEK
jgi:cysteine desulfurase